ncbi:MAG TPA: hypothetical protein VMA30_20600 [Xanthobacteraceae bacterium]|nr:hypothetical protein [Xanthobacteraceae bacterium]
MPTHLGIRLDLAGGDRIGARAAQGAARGLSQFVTAPYAKQ